MKQQILKATMTVGALRQALTCYPDDARIVLYQVEHGYFPLRDLEDFGIYWEDEAARILTWTTTTPKPPEISISEWTSSEV